MNLKTFYSDTVISVQAIDHAADNETIYGSGVDMAGYKGVIFIAHCQEGEAGTFTLKVQQDTASNYATAADLTGTGKSIVIATAAAGLAFVEVVDPQERYVRPALVVPNLGIARAISIIAIKYGGQYLPETVTNGELHVAPAEGTA